MSRRFLWRCIDSRMSIIARSTGGFLSVKDSGSAINYVLILDLTGWIAARSERSYEAHTLNARWIIKYVSIVRQWSANADIFGARSKLTYSRSLAMSGHAPRRALCTPCNTLHTITIKMYLSVKLTAISFHFTAKEELPGQVKAGFPYKHTYRNTYIHLP